MSEMGNSKKRPDGTEQLVLGLITAALAGLFWGGNLHGVLCGVEGYVALYFVLRSVSIQAAVNVSNLKSEEQENG